MHTLFPWPEHPALSIFVLWLVSAIFLWAARAPMLQDSGRHVVAALAASLLVALGALAGAIAHALRALFQILPNLYNVYVSVPLRIERAVRGDDPELERQLEPATDHSLPATADRASSRGMA